MELRAPVVDDHGTVIGALVVAELPRGARLRGAEAPEVVEGGTYRFSVELDARPLGVVVEPGSELFNFDDSSCLTGRLEPRQHVGRIRVTVVATEFGIAGTTELVVAPTKLEYATEYQQMLGDVAAIATEALLQGFAPAATALRSDSSAPPRLLYQQFAFLHARLASDELRHALAFVVASPHRAWVSETELIGAGRPLRGSSKLGRALTRPGARVDTNGRLRAATVPRLIERGRTDATFDSVPNRFVKYALERWRALAQTLLDQMRPQQAGVPSGPLRRGLQAAGEIVLQMDQLLALPVFHEVGRLDVFPSANQVLHRQEGYRQIFQTFALAEVGAQLSMDWDLDDAFSASQRNVATLYEYWAFLQLVDVLGDVCGEARSVEALSVSSDGLSLGFRQGKAGGVCWETYAGGREIEVEVFFNRTFGRSDMPNTDSSWSRPMRPDCSVHVRPRSKLPQVEQGALDVWLHFDAKYRVEHADAQFDSRQPDSPSAGDEAEKVERVGRSKREDLLKMHAYRDAIRRSAGAYVLFPGDDAGAPFREFTEPLPGLGALVLRPRSGERAVGWDTLRAFLADVLDHVADQASEHERDRYWRAVVRSVTPDQSPGGRRLPNLTMPPRDETVLCVGLTSAEQADWVAATGTVAVGTGLADPLRRVEAPELRPEWLLLYGVDRWPTLWRRTSAWSVQLADDLRQLGHPEPVAPAQLVTQVVRSEQPLEWLTPSLIADMFGDQVPEGHVRAVTWAELLTC